MTEARYKDNPRILAVTGTSYTIHALCYRMMVTFNNPSSVAVAINPSSDLLRGFHCDIENLGTGNVTLTPNGSEKIDGASSLTLSQNQGIRLWSDGSNLFTERGLGSGGGGSFTAGGDLSGTSSSQTVIGLQGKSLDSGTVGSPSDGDLITYDGASGKYKAAAPSGGGATITGYSQHLDGNSNHNLASGNQIQICTFYLDGSLSFSQIGVRLTTSDTGHLSSWGVYDSSGTLKATTTPAGFSSGFTIVSLTTSPITLSAGTYYFAFTSNNTGLSTAIIGGNVLDMLSSNVPAESSSSGALPSSITIPALTGGVFASSGFCFLLT